MEQNTDGYWVLIIHIQQHLLVSKDFTIIIWGGYSKDFTIINWGGYFILNKSISYRVCHRFLLNNKGKKLEISYEFPL